MDHKEREHALLSASSAHRWLKCTPSARLEDEFEDTTSEAAEEGTLAHEIAELKLQRYFYTTDMTKRKYNSRLKKLKENKLYQTEMDGYTDDYLEYVKKIALSFENTPYIAIEKKVDYSKWAPEGFGTADCILISGNHMHIIDLKYGKGVEVRAERNSQLRLYALGAINEYLMLYSIEHITLHIVQPRLDNYSSWDLDSESLNMFGIKVSKIARLAFDGEGEFLAGDWCRFCRARANCRARAEENVKLAFEIDKKPPLISNAEVGEYLRQGEDVAKWLKDLQEWALSECLAGREVAGWKAVEGRSTREWTDEERAINTVINNGVNEELLYEKKVLSLAKIEKLIGKAEFEKTVSEYVVKKPGKPTLVKESDKRQAITNVIKAEDVF